MKNNYWFIIILCMAWTAQSEESYTREDLRFETAVPVVDYPETVLNKKIDFNQKIDMAFQRTHITDELFFNNVLYSIKAGYHKDDFFALGAQLSFWQKGLNEYAEAFENSAAQLDFSRAAQPEKLYLLYLENLYFYGKINFSSGNIVLTNNLLGRYSVGGVQFSQEVLPYFNYSLSLQTFFDNNYFFEIGVGVSIYQIYNPISLSLRRSDSAPDKKDFSKKIQISQNLNLGIGFLF